MLNLIYKIFNNGVIIISLMQSSCTSTSFLRVVKTYEGYQVFEATPDRFMLWCEKVSDENELYMFFLYILNNDKKLDVISHGRTMELGVCKDMLKNIENKIVREAKVIQIGGLGNLNEPTVLRSDMVEFNNKGKFQETERIFDFTYISNDKGACFGPIMWNDKPCPMEPFPLP